MIPLMAARIRPRDTRFPMGRVVLKSIIDADLSEKAAALTMGYTDASQFSKALAGRAPLDLWELWLLPLAFWHKFVGNVMRELILWWFDDLQQPYRMAKVQVEPAAKKEQVS